MQNLLLSDDRTLEDIGQIPWGEIVSGIAQAGSAAYGAYTQRKIAGMTAKHNDRMAARRAELDAKSLAIDNMLASATVSATKAKQEHDKKMGAIQLKIQNAQATLMEKKLQETQALNSIRAAEKIAVATGRVKSIAERVAAGTYTYNGGDEKKVLGLDKKTFSMVAIGGGVLLIGILYFAKKKK